MLFEGGSKAEKAIWYADKEERYRIDVYASIYWYTLQVSVGFIHNFGLLTFSERLLYLSYGFQAEASRSKVSWKQSRK